MRIFELVFPRSIESAVFVLFVDAAFQVKSEC